MAFSSLNTAWTQWYQTYRPGNAASGTPGTALVSDLASGDFLCGVRAHIVSTGTTTSGNRTLTLDRNGFQWTQTMVAASSVLIIRP